MPASTKAQTSYPDYVRDEDIHLSKNSLEVLRRRYLRRGEDGEPIETPAQMFYRVAHHLGKAEAIFGGDVEEATETFYHMLTNLRFFPNSPTFTGAGTPLGQLAACFTADMRVTTDRGVKPIVQLKPGDRVLTHKGRFRPVTEVMQRRYQGDLLHIKVKLIGTTMEVTPEHPILTPSGWVEAGDLQVGDWVAIGAPNGQQPRPRFDLAESVYAHELELQVTEEAVRARRPSTYQNSGRQSHWVRRFIDLTPDLARLCGYYVAEGTIGPDETYVRFTFHEDEKAYQQDVIHLVKKIFDAPVNTSVASQGKWISINVYSRVVASWFQKHFGHGSTHKRLPTWLQYADRDIQEQFFIGLMRGDGMFFERQYFVKGRKSAKTFRSLRLTLSNPELIQQIWQMALRLGYDASIRPVDTSYVTPNASDAAQISMPPLSSRDLVKKAFGIDLPEPDARYLRSHVRRENGATFFQIERIDITPYDGVVYNCEVDEDHTYVTEGVVVHNCFVLPIEDDMGKHPDGIFMTLRNAALIQQTGGGNGFSFSRLRPRGDRVMTSKGIATGPVGFLEAYDRAFDVIAQGGTRRGANMAVLNVDHPDIEEFISAKAEEGRLTNFNISVGITDAFMEAVEKGEDFDLINPRTGKVWKTVNARELFDKIAYYAHKNGEPGLLFLDTANRTNPVPHLYKLEATNPCFVGDTRIPTEFGLLTIAELAEMERGGFIVTDNRALPDETAGEHPGVALRLASPAWMTRRQTRVMKLTTKQGYTVTATPDHRFLTPNGYVELQDLKPGDAILLQSGEGVWSREEWLPNLEALQVKMAVTARGGDHARGHTTQRRDFRAPYANLPERWSHDLGVVLGVLVGDGWLSETSNSPVGFAIAEPELLARVHEPMKRWFGQGHLHQQGDATQLTYGRLPYEFFRTLGVSETRAHEKRVPESIWRAPREAVVGFLQGLFSADGSVQVNEAKQDCTVRLASSSQALLQDVQVLLSNFGIMARIYRREAGQRLMPDGKGGRALYDHRAQYELVIDKANRDRFAETIGFLQRKKQDELLSFIRNKTRTSNRETYQDEVLSIEDAGIADVYDLTQPDTHSMIANGFVCHNCGEQWLGPYENCCLGSVNLAQHVTEDGRVDWEKLQETVEQATRFLDNVVEVNAYVPAVPQLKEAAHRVRRIGMGIMGLADVMYALGVRYGSEESIDLAGQLMEFVRFHAMRTSIELAKERGAFPAIKGSIYDPDDLKWQPPTPIVPYKQDFGRPELDWNEIVEGIKTYGIRNGAQTTIAPTGTIGTVTGCEGYGCEPVFALAYTRYVKEAEGDVALEYVSPLFLKALEKEGIEGERKRRIIDQIKHDGTCQRVEELPEHIRHTFVVSMDITPEEHVIMQAALQRFVDNSISKTINFPPEATVEDVKTAYKMAWELGCKGITVYVTGSRQEVVLETKAVAESKKKGANGTSAEMIEAVQEVHVPQRRPRPQRLMGLTYRRETPLGTAYITINQTEEREPFEVFLNVGKAGSDVAAVSEALGRLISYILRMPSYLTPTERLEQVVYQLAGIGGGRPLGFGPNRVRSLPDAVAQVLDAYLKEQKELQLQLAPPDEEVTPPPGQMELPLQQIGDLCPECGQATLLNIEGCKKCINCGYSEC